MNVKMIMMMLTFFPLGSTIFSMLYTPEASLAALKDKAGTIAGVLTGKMIIYCTTLAELDMKGMSE